MLQKKYRLIVFAIMFMAISVRAQNFSYTLTKDSSSYTELISPTVLTASGDNWFSKRFSVQLPFQFNLCGSTTDSLLIEGNGFIVFDQMKQLSIVAFNNFRSNKDTTQNYVSSIAYLTSGSQGNRITKIEFKNLSQNSLSNNDYLNYQVWLYENGDKIEFRVGTNSYGSNPESASPALLGIVNRNMDTEDKAYLVSGSQYDSAGQLISGDNEFVYLNNVPSQGTVLKLIPTF